MNKEFVKLNMAPSLRWLCPLLEVLEMLPQCVASVLPP